MKIKKLGHCCFIVEAKGKRILTDPGAPDYSGLVGAEIGHIDAVLITHEHSDHLHIDSLKQILASNPSAMVVTNTAVGKLLDEAGIKYTKVENGEDLMIGDVNVSGFGDIHAEIYKEFGMVQNTGYMIDDLCYPGDSFNIPNTSKVDILALPVVGPWVLMKNAIEYAQKINPRIVFPVHDAIVKDFGKFVWFVPETILKESGIAFKKLEIGKEEEL